MRVAAVLAAVSAAAAFASPASAASLDGLHDARYCEIIELRGAPPNARATVWNTIGLNKCPAAWWNAFDAADLSAALSTMARGSQRAAPLAPLAQHALVDGLEADTPLRLRAHLSGELTLHDGCAALTSRAGSVRLEAHDVRAVEVFLTESVTTAGELGVDLARRLVLAGIAVPA